MLKSTFNHAQTASASLVRTECGVEFGQRLPHLAVIPDETTLKVSKPQELLELLLGG